ncbi:unnamed protein product [Adineta steineri]|uniref:Uncharacterized protein n=1 Tax=Adineta steineri TaxID=433720 RepID=A0A814YS46_9BILA|nr:unnamed protein product [Adineta steineri]CAF1523807.1 unnamed protein product [Adineta steineri]
MLHLSNKRRVMNKTFTILSNKYCSFHNDIEQNQSNSICENIDRLSITSNDPRFCTFTKYKINQHQQRYFDSPTMIIPDDDDDDDIPISRCSNKTSFVEPNLNETELSDLLIFTNPCRILSESMHVVISRHPSLQDLKYINDVSSLLVDPQFVQNKDEPIYQELIRLDHLIATPPSDHINDIDENKENRPPLMPIKCSTSRIPIWTPSPNNKTTDTSNITEKIKKNQESKKKTTTTSAKPCLNDLLDEWSSITPQLKQLLSNTRKMPIRVDLFSALQVHHFINNTLLDASLNKEQYRVSSTETTVKRYGNNNILMD